VSGSSWLSARLAGGCRLGWLVAGGCRAAFETEESNGRLFKAFRLAQSVWWAIIILSRLINFYSLCIFFRTFLWIKNKYT